MSLWQHKIVERDGRWFYDDSLARWTGAGKNLLKEHLGVAYREGLRLRAVVATKHNRAERERDSDKAPRKTFKARPDWVGHVALLDGDHFVLAFDHVGETATTPAGVKYWRVAYAPTLRTLRLSANHATCRRDFLKNSPCRKRTASPTTPLHPLSIKAGS
ncbi:hypothetical protein [Stenotrophomonas sp. Ker107b]